MSMLPCPVSVDACSSLPCVRVLQVILHAVLWTHCVTTGLIAMINKPAFTCGFVGDPLVGACIRAPPQLRLGTGEPCTRCTVVFLSVCVSLCLCPFICCLCGSLPLFFLCPLSLSLSLSLSLAPTPPPLSPCLCCCPLLIRALPRSSGGFVPTPDAASGPRILVMGIPGLAVGRQPMLSRRCG